MVRVRLTARAIRTIEHNGGLDSFLLGTADRDLGPEARRLKRRIADVLADGEMDLCGRKSDVQPLLETPKLSELTCGLGRSFPKMAGRAIRLSHGRPF